MKRYKIFIYGFLFLFSTNVFAQGKDLSLNDALNFALEGNDLINASKQQKEFAKYEKKAAKGNMFPHLYVEGAVTRINEPIILSLADARAAVIGSNVATYSALGGPYPEQFKQLLESKIPAFDMKFQDELFYNLSANLVLPLYTGGKISANSKAKETEYEISKMQYDTTVNSTITSVIENYFTAKLAQEAMKIRANYLEDINKHCTNAQKLFDVGMISKTNKLRADVALKEAQREYDKSVRDYELSLVVLSNVIGESITEDNNLSTNLNLIEELKDITFYLQTSYSNNITLKALNKKQTMLQQKTKSIKAEFLPTVALFGKYEIYQDDLTVFEPDWAAGIKAKLDIFNGGSSTNEYKAYSAQQEALKLNIENASKLIATAVKKYHHEAETAKQQYESLQSSMELTEENLKLYKKSFEEGLATSIEVIDAELALEKVNLDQLKAIYEYNVAYAKLVDICNLSKNLINIDILGDSNDDEE